MVKQIKQNCSARLALILNGQSIIYSLAMSQFWYRIIKPAANYHKYGRRKKSRQWNVYAMCIIHAVHVHDIKSMYLCSNQNVLIKKSIFPLKCNGNDTIKQRIIVVSLAMIVYFVVWCAPVCVFRVKFRIHSAHAAIQHICWTIQYINHLPKHKDIHYLVW